MLRSHLREKPKIMSKLLSEEIYIKNQFIGYVTFKYTDIPHVIITLSVFIIEAE